MALGDGSLQNEWAPERMWAPKKGDLELGKFEPHYFRTSYTDINKIIKKIISAKQNRTGLHLDPH